METDDQATIASGVALTIADLGRDEALAWSLGAVYGAAAAWRKSPAEVVEALAKTAFWRENDPASLWDEDAGERIRSALALTAAAGMGLPRFRRFAGHLLLAAATARDERADERSER